MRGGDRVVVAAVVLSFLILTACSDSEEMLARPTAAAACGAYDPDDLRFQVCTGENGTVTDWNPDSTLIWLKDADCFGRLTFADARAAAAGLEDGDCGLTDKSTPGAWRLPTKEEWERIVRTEDCNIGEPHIPNDADDACWSEEDHFTTVHPSGYWSSTEGSSARYVWMVYLNDADFIPDAKTAIHYVWPVRSP